jgi:hypothetical protein
MPDLQGEIHPEYREKRSGVDSLEGLGKLIAIRPA